jgi:hypothetical protein
LVRQLQECEEKNKENEYLIYSWKIFDKLCKNSRDNTYCAQIYYDYLQINR